MKFKCDHPPEEAYKCNHCMFNREKKPWCIHQDDESCFHCRFMDPSMAKGIDPNPPAKQTTTDYPAGMLWVENIAILQQLSGLYSQLKYAKGGFWDDDDECYFKPDPVKEEQVRKQIADLIAYIKMADQLKNAEWDRGKFKDCSHK